MNEEDKKRHSVDVMNAYSEELDMMNTQMLVSIANTLKDIADSLKKIEEN